MDQHSPHGAVPADLQAGQLDAATLARMAADPAQAQALAWLQNQAADTLSAMIDQMAESLPADAPPPAMGAGMDVRALAAASRHTARGAQERRELAEALVIGALLNDGNPGWDPADPSTHRPSLASPFLQLLRMKLPGQPA